MSIISYIKLGIIAILVIVCSYLVWNYHHMEAKIAAQKIQIDNLQLEQEVLAKKQKAFDMFMTQKVVVKRKVVHEEQQVDETVDSGDVGRIIDLFHGLRSDKIKPSADGGTGRALPAPGRKASP